MLPQKSDIFTLHQLIMELINLMETLFHWCPYHVIVFVDFCSGICGDSFISLVL